MDLDFDLPRSRNRSSRRSWRRRHRHLFAWLVLGGAAVVLLIAILGVISALGLGGVIASAYFGVLEAVAPTAWHDELHAIPTIVHVIAGIAFVGIVAGLLGELFD